MRNLATVIDQLLTIIPKEETSLRKGLENVKSSSLFSPPEMQGERWLQCAEVLASNVPEPTTDWQKSVRDVFLGNEFARAV